MSDSISWMSSARLGATACSFQALSSPSDVSIFCTWRETERRHGRERGQLLLESPPQSRGAARGPLAERGVCLADECVDLAQRRASAAAVAARAASSASRRAAVSAASRSASSRVRADSSSARRAASTRSASRAIRAAASAASCAMRCWCSAMISSQRSMARAARLRKSGAACVCERLPARVEVPQGRLVNRLIDPVRVPLKRLAGADGIAAAFSTRLLLGIERVAFLANDLVDVLVLAVQLLHELPELGGIRHRLRRELADAARGTGEHERSALRLVDRGESAGQPLGVAGISRHGEEGGDVHGRRTAPRNRGIPHR